MSFISKLNTQLEEQEFHNQVASSKWVCSVDTGVGIVNSNPTLDFKICPPTGGAISVISISWENSTPQLVPGHYLLRSGTWDVKAVKLSGLIVRRSIKLETTRKLLEANKVSISEAQSSSQGQKLSLVKSLEEENAALKTALAVAKKELAQSQSEIIKLKLQIQAQPSNEDVFSGWTENDPK
ncbi:MAG: ORF1 [Physalis torrado virus]|uniref:ORF1 n=1 Tax=Physalis torrado virus TaxID=2885927 RepID=A0AAE8YCM9_9SECO|nr:MAG: ORF1 [Physalis torrado virus]